MKEKRELTWFNLALAVYGLWLITSDPHHLFWGGLAIWLSLRD